MGVIVLSWNRRDRVVECIDRLRLLHGVSAKIIIVDNASADDSYEEFQRRFPDVVVLRNPTNLGYVGGVNVGLQEALRLELDFAWLLNDDTTFDASTLSDLVAFAEAHPDHGIYSPVIRNTPDGLGEPQFGNGLVDWDCARLREHMPEEEFASRTRGGATPVLIGAALFLSLAVVARIGFLDPRFFAYWEDIDFTVRAARAGFVPLVAPHIVVLHDAPPISSRAPHFYYYMLRNESLFWTLHRAGKPLRWRLAWLAKAFAWLGQHRALGQQGNVQACADAIWDAFHARYGQRPSQSAPKWFVWTVSARPRFMERLCRGQIRLIFGRGN